MVSNKQRAATLDFTSTKYRFHFHFLLLQGFRTRVNKMTVDFAMKETVVENISVQLAMFSNCKLHGWLDDGWIDEW